MEIVEALGLTTASDSQLHNFCGQPVPAHAPSENESALVPMIESSPRPKRPKWDTSSTSRRRRDYVPRVRFAKSSSAMKHYEDPRSPEPFSPTSVLLKHSRSSERHDSLSPSCSSQATTLNNDIHPADEEGVDMCAQFVLAVEDALPKPSHHYEHMFACHSAEGVQAVVPLAEAFFDFDRYSREDEDASMLQVQ
jgi:hypothetical protein